MLIGVLQRDGEAIGWLNITDMQWDRAINSSDEFTFTVQRDVVYSQTPCVDDEIYVEESVDGERRPIGTAVVEDVEASYDSGGQTIFRLTGKDQMSWILAHVANPSSKFIEAVDLTETASRIIQLINFLTTRETAISFINPVGIDRSIASGEASNCLELIGKAVISSDSRWRCVANADIPTIEMGRFGDDSGFTVRCDPHAVIQARSAGLMVTSSASERVSTKDQFNSIFPEGGSYVNSNNVSIPVLLVPGISVAPGFNMALATYPDGAKRYRIDKVFDSQGNLIPTIARKSKAMSFSAITVSTTDGAMPSQAQKMAAAQELADISADVLKANGEPIYSWSFDCEGSITDEFYVGDKLHLNILDDDGVTVRSVDPYVVSINSAFKGDGSVTNRLELSTKLESLADPLDRGEKNLYVRPRGSAGYEASVSCNPVGVYTFIGYTSAPSVDDVRCNCGTVTVGAVTSASATFTVSNCPDLPATVYFYVSPAH